MISSVNFLFCFIPIYGHGCIAATLILTVNNSDEGLETGLETEFLRSLFRPFAGGLGLNLDVVCGDVVVMMWSRYLVF